MASIFRREGSWVVKWKDGAGRWRQERTAFPTKLAAQEYGRELDRKATFQRAGLEPMAAPVSMTFAELLDWHAENFGDAFKSQSDSLVAGRHLRPALGPLSLVDVTAAKIDEVLSSKTKALAPKTLKQPPRLRAVGVLQGDSAEGVARREPRRRRAAPTRAEARPLVPEA